MKENFDKYLLLWKDKKLLIIDDVDINHKLTQELIGFTDINISAVSGSKEAHAACLQDKFDVILMNYDLKSANPVSILQGIRANDSLMPVVTYTGSLMSKREDMLKAGFNKVLSLPLCLPDLLVAIRDCL